MSETWLIGDTHFGHKNIIHFTDKEGKRIRPFHCLTEMHVTIVENWNNVVGKNDTVYHMGDVAFTLDGLNILHMLNGKLRLIRGNHDKFSMGAYAEHFEQILGVKQIDGYWLTHVPMHPYCLQGGKRQKYNIHGHLHANTIDDPRYLNVSVERIDYTPVTFDHVKKMIKAQCVSAGMYEQGVIAS